MEEEWNWIKPASFKKRLGCSFFQCHYGTGAIWSALEGNNVKHFEWISEWLNEWINECHSFFSTKSKHHNQAMIYTAHFCIFLLEMLLLKMLFCLPCAGKWNLSQLFLALFASDHRWNSLQWVLDFPSSNTPGHHWRGIGVIEEFIVVTFPSFMKNPRLLW